MLLLVMGHHFVYFPNQDGEWFGTETASASCSTLLAIPAYPYLYHFWDRIAVNVFGFAIF
jgi:hypothetical protein